MICVAIIFGLGGVMAKFNAHFELSKCLRFQSLAVKLSVASFVTLLLLVSLVGILNIMANP